MCHRSEFRTEIVYIQCCLTNIQFSKQCQLIVILTQNYVPSISVHKFCDEISIIQKGQ